MKKLLSLICILVVSLSAGAQEEIDGLFYVLNANDKTASVTENIDMGYSGSVTIPETVTSNNITYTVTAVDDFAFYDCSGLSVVTLPETVERIGMYAFQNCAALKTINIPGGLTFLGEQAFGECAALDGIKLPATLNNTGVSAFEGCTSLKDITIANGITSIPDGMFARCEALEKLEIPQSVTEIGGWALSNCISLKQLTLNEGLESIGECAISFCYELQDITLPSTVTTIGTNAFAYCLSLSQFTFSKDIETVGDYIFDNCEMLGMIRSVSNMPFKVMNDKLVDYKDQTVICVPVGARDNYINDEAWKGFAEYREISDNDTCDYRLRRISKDGFNFIVSDLDSRLAKLVSNRENLYSGNVEIPASVTDDDGNTYTINHIGEGAFELCTDLLSVVIPTSVTSIGEWAFSGCHTLNDIDIPTSVTRIGNAAFFGCNYIYSVTLHDTLEFIGDDAFGGCFSLSSIYSEIVDPFMIGEFTFDFREEQTLYIPYGCKNFYKNTDYWWKFVNIVEDDNLGISNTVIEDAYNNSVYDIQGRKLNAPVKGVNIINNKKVLF